MKQLSIFKNQLFKLFPNRKIKQILSEEPCPILFPEKRLILIWSAKSGSTFVIKWMFAQMGLSPVEKTKGNWLHDFRMNSYCGSMQHLTGQKLFLKDPGSFNIIKVADDPFKRAVRSYIHACIHDYEDTKLSSFLHRNINSENRFSFREFSHYLMSIDINKCDVHHRSQISDLERTNFVDSIRIIRLEDTMKEIPKLEKLYKLKKIDLLPLRNSNHHRPKYRTFDFMGDAVMNEISQVPNATVPEYKQFYNEEIMEIISDVYQEDFERYNYEKIIR